jgi:hypothetical protein
MKGKDIQIVGMNDCLRPKMSSAATTANELDKSNIKAGSNRHGHSESDVASEEKRRNLHEQNFSLLPPGSYLLWRANLMPENSPDVI